MRNTKEVKTILSVIFYLNRLSENEDVEIRNLLDYAFYRLFNTNTNLLLLATIGSKRNECLPAIMEILKENTEYIKFMEERKR